MHMHLLVYFEREEINQQLAVLLFVGDPCFLMSMTPRHKIEINIIKGKEEGDPDLCVCVL